MMDAHDMRALAQRCRELSRIATDPEIKEQLVEWIDDFETEAEAIEADAEALG
jgi:hypothetical protein